MCAMDDAYAARLAAAEPRNPRPLAELVRRLEAEERLRTGTEAVAAGAPVDGLSIAGLAYDSRAVTPGSLFVAVPGDHVDGHDYVADAARRGATIALVERRVDADVPQLIVDRALLALAVAAAWWYGDPSSALGVVGVTGTDGKTSTARLTAAVLEAGGWPTGIVSTIGGRIGGADEKRPPHATTPQAPELQRALAAMRSASDRAAVVETTSHGLAQGRVNGVRYDLAVFTNISHEHLDFHGTFEAYLAAKRSLFERLAVDERNPAKPAAGWPRTGIVNVDDPAAGSFVEATRGAGARLLGYGRDPSAELRLLEVNDDGRRLHVHWDGPAGRQRAALQLAGRFNAYNALAAAAVGEAIGLEAVAVVEGLEGLQRVPGRMERIDLGQPFGVVVDYAHSPNALKVVLDELGPTAEAGGGGLIAVFGSAGERDPEKRPMMGRIAAERSRLVIATDEDPRDEDRMTILEAIAAGAETAGAVRGKSVLLIPDRREAIREAVRAARPGDVVLLAGKGHENTILMANSAAITWDERAEAEAALHELGFTR
jgi:UDP-N-acetylmuramoyl-L-alanyl-D-glutamate--2,6-diaminopimelate ligase